jgi:perosamine synthetase
MAKTRTKGADDMKQVRQIPLSGPDITAKERAAVDEVLAGSELSLGPRLPRFEQALADYVGCREAVVMNSGTSALHAIVRGLGLGAGDEIITTPFSFIASANCILFEGARPVFVDIETDTLALDVGRIEGALTPRTRAILAVDVFGHPAPWDELRSLADRHGLILIEDSAEALGSVYRGRRAGALGDVGVFGFYPNKQITTGEGGALVTDDAGLAAVCRSLRNQGRAEESGWYQHVRLGYNYRASELACALGLAQLSRIDEILAKRARVATWYQEGLADVPELILPAVGPEVSLSWFVYVVRLQKDQSRMERDRILAGLRERGIGCRAYFPPIHLQPFYRAQFGFREGMFPVTESVAARTIALPFHGNLTREEVEYVVACLRQVIGKWGRVQFSAALGAEERRLDEDGGT